ncbi:hypothetical protein K0M31_013627 [Melipona bicolor]|uniref:Uncharacterized protein n=1 Tax=Melipona bicolor TaxID=60889 RepID=A0AA40FHL3_9HYME|nr:hypothetical protein K0M31_013627 [Melipona bicolor]
MDMESLYDYGEEEQDFYEESPGTRKGYPIDHRSIKRDARGVGSYLGGGSISDGGGMLTVMAKLMKQELASDAEEEGLVPALSGRFTSMRKVPSLSDLSDPESSLGEFFFSFPHSLETRTVNWKSPGPLEKSSTRRASARIL